MLFSLFIIYKKKIKFKELIIGFLIIVTTTQITYNFLIDPKLGAGRDWDLFASMGIGYTVLGIYLFINLVQSKKYSGLVLIYTTLLCSLPFFLLNANTNRSIERFRNLLDLDIERSLNGRWNIANYFYRQGMFIESEQIKSEIFKLFPGDSLAREAQKYIKSGEYDKATILLKKAIETNPNIQIVNSIYHELGNVYFLQGKIDEALNVYQRVVRLNPLDQLIHMNLGQTLLRKDRLDEALKEFKKSEKLGLKEPGAFCDIAYIYLRFGETGKAIKAYKKVLKINPEYFYPHFGLGQIYLERNSLDEALIEFNQSKMLKSDFAPTYYNLGVIYSRKGLKDKAIENYELFLKYSKDEAQNEKVRGLIQQLRSQSP
ncbi:MAG: tetratricopeptide repeat protein [candidate division Zixibacteria bacterium]|nr:tetratricopeptide repeat protein [candidate division Zixibacteria bacterium]